MTEHLLQEQIWRRRRCQLLATPLRHAGAGASQARSASALLGMTVTAGRRQRCTARRSRGCPLSRYFTASWPAVVTQSYQHPRNRRLPRSFIHSFCYLSTHS